MKLKKILRLLIEESVSGILESKLQSRARLVSKFSNIEFTTKYIDSDDDHTRIELKLIDSKEYFKLTSGEAIHFALAAFASFQRAKQTQDKNAAWGIIEQYYAAYYSIHFLMRMCGISITNIDSKVVSRIRECSFGITVPEIIPKGLYRFEYIESSETLILEKLPKGGGSHKDAWKEWEKVVNKLKTHTAADITEYADADSLLSSHLDFFVRTPDLHYNPPDIRGEINYQFANTTWFFEEISDERVKLLNTRIRNNDYVFHSSDEKVVKFSSNNALIFSLANNMFEHLVQSYPSGAYRNIKNKHKYTIKSMLENA